MTDDHDTTRPALADAAPRHEISASDVSWAGLTLLMLLFAMAISLGDL